jgi:hypothetical protein
LCGQVGKRWWDTKKCHMTIQLQTSLGTFIKGWIQGEGERKLQVLYGSQEH